MSISFSRTLAMVLGILTPLAETVDDGVGGGD